MQPTRQRLSNLLAWRAFEVAARTGTFVAASEELNVTSAAISQHVRTLEDYLGVKLFTRTAQGVVLTPEGHLVYPGVRDGFQRIAEAVHMLHHREHERIVRVTAPPSLASHWMLHRLHRFNRRHPELSVNLDASTRLVDFNAESFDVGVRYGKGHYEGLQSQLLFEEFMFPVCSPTLSGDGNESISLEALARLPLIHDTTVHFESDLPNWKTWFERQGVKGINADRGLYLSSVLAVQAAVEGRGVLLGRSVIVADELAAGRLVRPVEAAQKVDRAYYLVYREDRRDCPKVRAFCEWIIEEAMQSRAADIIVNV
jgi:LysR family glycine cleavage system transcriptional activator